MKKDNVDILVVNMKGTANSLDLGRCWLFLLFSDLNFTATMFQTPKASSQSSGLIGWSGTSCHGGTGYNRFFFFLNSVFLFSLCDSRDVKALQPEGQFRAGAPNCNPKALHHLRVPAGVSGLSDKQHRQGMNKRGQKAARITHLHFFFFFKQHVFETYNQTFICSR